jgi:serine/threonine protein kinase
MMSELKITHADIKTDNIFVKTSGDETSASWASNEPQLRLGDFGISAMLKPAGDKQCVFGIGGLSLKWASPESMILSLAGYGYQCVTSDVYSLGVVMFQFLAAKSAFPWMARAGHIYGSDPPADTNKWFLKTRLDLATNALNDPDLPLLETTLIEKGQSSRKKNSIVQNLVVNYAKKIHDVYAGEAAGIKADIKAQVSTVTAAAKCSRALTHILLLPCLLCVFEYS